MRFLGGDLVAGEQQLEGAAAADEPRQALRSGVARNQSEVDLRLAELRGVGGDTHRARHRQLAAATEREAIDRGDHRLTQTFDPIEQRLAMPRVLAAGDWRLHRKFVDVGAGHERLLAGTSQNDRPHRGVVACGRDLLIQFGQRRGVQRVQHFRPVDRDRQHAAVALDEQVFVGHIPAIILRGPRAPGARPERRSPRRRRRARRPPSPPRTGCDRARRPDGIHR